MRAWRHLAMNFAAVVWSVCNLISGFKKWFGEEEEGDRWELRCGLKGGELQ